MNKRKVLIFMVLIMTMFALTWGAGPVRAQVPPGSLITGANGYYIPDYFATPNWANSPPLTKFVDGLPGTIGAAPLANNLGQCIPIAVPDTDNISGLRLLRNRVGPVSRAECTRCLVQLQAIRRQP